MSTDFVVDVSPPLSVPLEFRVFTSRLDTFAGTRLPTAFEWGSYHIEVYFGRRPRRQPSPKPILDYSSISAGGRVIEDLTSTTYSHPNRFRHAIFSRKVAREDHSPTVMLMDGMEPGQCWAFRGNAGQLAIQLPKAIRVSSLAVGHANVLSIASAPKKLIIWGLKPTDSELCGSANRDVGMPTPADFGSGYCGIRLCSGTHEPSTSTFYQNFTVSTTDSHNNYFDRVVVQVLGNWGHQSYTCMYRIQVYGSAQ